MDFPTHRLALFDELGDGAAMENVVTLRSASCEEVSVRIGLAPASEFAIAIGPYNVTLCVAFRALLG